MAGEDHDAQWRRWREASGDPQVDITEHAAMSEENRYELEQALSARSRHAAEDSAE
ncbi:hypothetical protein ACH47Z_44250 [Streptomyces sp. NPDC020192]|uniref:hypothetical protein n=1 Tax=Streptomyces sp. NPDC020192 TaxID=3365066 RepID=UPI0037924590